ncbi:hypothetical protein MY8738_010062 [Beauveria namnaoensis]
MKLHALHFPECGFSEVTFAWFLDIFRHQANELPEFRRALAVNHVATVPQLAVFGRRGRHEFNFGGRQILPYSTNDRSEPSRAADSDSVDDDQKSDKSAEAGWM